MSEMKIFPSLTYETLNGSMSVGKGVGGRSLTGLKYSGLDSSFITGILFVLKVFIGSLRKKL